MYPQTKQFESSGLVVLHQGAIGDFLLALSVIQPLRSCLKAARVVAIAGAASARVAAGRGAIDAHAWPEDVGLHTLFGEDTELDQRLRRLLSGADCVLSFLGGVALGVSEERRAGEARHRRAQPAVTTHLQKQRQVSSRRVGTSPALPLSFLSERSGRIHQRLCAATTGRVVSLDPRPTTHTLANGWHITRQWCSAIRDAGLQVGEPTPPVIRVEPAGDRAGRPRARVIVHPGSGGADKCWPIERFVEVVASLEGARVTWLLGPAECERDAGRNTVVRERVAAGDAVIANEDLSVVARMIAGADLYLGNDAGPTHLAAAMGIPTVAVFGPTDPRVWRPLGDHVTAVAPARAGDSIAEINVDQVRDAVQDMLRSVWTPPA